MVDSKDTKDSPVATSWQSSSKQTPAEADPTSSDKEVTIEQAKRFLQDDEVKNATTDKKIAFLESKGLQSDDIQQVLGVTRNAEASSTTSNQTSQSESPPHSPPPPPSPPPAPPSPPQADPVYAPPRDSPPIITYPEFLTTSPHVTPLITKPRLLTTLYLFSSLSFLLYGTSTYLVTPMLESLTSSRLSLFATASENLSKLVSRLEGLVSEIPVTTPGKKSATLETPYKDADEDSDSDPTELFHRDIGVQTSLPSTPASPTLSPVTSNLESQRHTLTSLKSSIQSLIEDDTDSANENQELEATVSVLKEYCEQLAYVVPVPTYGFSSYASSAKPEDKNDEIAKAKAAIRSVKGVLLSARSFPGGVRATAR